ncbi:MAG TPA: tyrosine-type recombinase/integrase [Micromonospora sp.]
MTGPALVAWHQDQAWAIETRRAHRTTQRRFYGWAVTQGLIECSPALALPPVRPATPRPRPTPDQAYRAALAAAGPRERLMIRLAAEAGLRRAEVAAVHPERDLVEDLDGWSLWVHGKGGRDRLVPLPASLAAALLRLPAGWAFPGDDGGHLSPRWVGRLVTDLLPGEWTMHSLRHRAGTRWWRTSGGDMFAVQELLGHASPVTTRVYVRVDADRLRRTVEGAL